MERPRTAAEVAAAAGSLEEFGRSVRDWQHELRGVTTRVELSARIETPPSILKRRFKGGAVADAYLAAYCCFLADKAGVERSPWTVRPGRILEKPWFSHSDRRRLLVTAPSPFRERNVFAEPENVVTLRPGRPPFPKETLRRHNAERQRRYRQRLREELRRLRALAQAM